MPWETAQPANVTVCIETQCHPISQQIPHIRRPIHAVALALLEHGQLKAYQIAQALDSVASFWERYSSGDADLEDFEEDFGGEKHRAKKKAARWLEYAISILRPGDECPVCKVTHVQIASDESIVCAGECGVVRAAPPAETEPDGSQQGDQDGQEGSGSTNDGDGSGSEEADQGDR